LPFQVPALEFPSREATPRNSYGFSFCLALSPAQVGLGGAFLSGSGTNLRVPQLLCCGRTPSHCPSAMDSSAWSQYLLPRRRAGLFLNPSMALGWIKGYSCALSQIGQNSRTLWGLSSRSEVHPLNIPHQYLDGHRYPSRALRRYSVPDARKRDFAYLCQRSFRPGVSTLNPGGLIFSKCPEEATKIIRAPASCSDHRRCEGLPSALYQIEQRGRLSSRERFWSLQQVVFGHCPSCLLCCAAGVKRGAATIDLPDSRGALTPSTYRVSCD